VLEFAVNEGYAVRGLVKSSLKGPKGNVEFLVHLKWPGAGEGFERGMISKALASQTVQD